MQVNQKTGCVPETSGELEEGHNGRKYTQVSVEKYNL